MHEYKLIITTQKASNKEMKEMCFPLQLPPPLSPEMQVDKASFRVTTGNTPDDQETSTGRFTDILGHGQHLVEIQPF